MGLTEADWATDISSKAKPAAGLAWHSGKERNFTGNLVFCAGTANIPQT
jgi:hypothetical protein